MTVTLAGNVCYQNLFSTSSRAWADLEQRSNIFKSEIIDFIINSNRIIYPLLRGVYLFNIFDIIFFKIC